MTGTTKTIQVSPASFTIEFLKELVDCPNTVPSRAQNSLHLKRVWTFAKQKELFDTFTCSLDIYIYTQIGKERYNKELS